MTDTVYVVFSKDADISRGTTITEFKEVPRELGIQLGTRLPELENEISSVDSARERFEAVLMRDAGNERMHDMAVHLRTLIEERKALVGKASGYPSVWAASHSDRHQVGSIVEKNRVPDAGPHMPHGMRVKR